MVDFFGGMGALLGFFLAVENVYADAAAAGAKAPCKAMTTETVGECMVTMAAAGLMPFAVSIAVFGFLGLLVGVLLSRAMRSRSGR